MTFNTQSTHEKNIPLEVKTNIESQSKKEYKNISQSWRKSFDNTAVIHDLRVYAIKLYERERECELFLPK